MGGACDARLTTRVDGALRTLSPGYFALVMATGIVSDGQLNGGSRLLSRLLFAIAVVTFAALVLLMAGRFVRHRSALADDLAHPLHGFGVYTWVAAANILAARIARDHTLTAEVLLVVATLIWLVRGYAVPWTTRLGADERPIAFANGTWFLWAVSCQSIAVVAAVLDGVHRHHGIAMAAVCAWCVGVFLYVVAGVLVTIRLVVLGVSAEELTPPFWVSMGAAAITVLAGAEILQMPPGPVRASAHELVVGGCLVAWSIATWLLPGLAATGWWRHVTHRVPLRYDVGLWSVVFPLGMYAEASRELAHVEVLPFLAGIGRVFLWIALAAWLLTAAALVGHVVTTVLLRPAAHPS